MTTLIKINEVLGGGEGSLNAHAGHPPPPELIRVLWGRGGDDECGLNGELRQL